MKSRDTAVATLTNTVTSSDWVEMSRDLTITSYLPGRETNVYTEEAHQVPVDRVPTEPEKAKA